MKSLTAVFFVGFFTCSALAADLPQLFAKSEAGMADAELKVQRTEKTADGNLAITAAALAGKETVAIQVILPARWQSSAAKGIPIKLSSGTITLRSLGKDTEAFVKAIATAYHQKTEPFAFTEITLTAISLMGDPNRITSAPVQMKVFHESDKEEEYAEAFVNIDLQHGIVQFHEKDSDYRKAVIAFLSRKKANSEGSVAP